LLQHANFLFLFFVFCFLFVFADLNGLSDPQCKLTFGALKKKTRIVKKSLNPIWSEDFAFKVTSEQLAADPNLYVEIWDWDRLSSSDFMGSVTINLADLPPRETVAKYYTLEGREKKSSSSAASSSSDIGSLRLKLCWTVHTILPSVCYEPLLNMLFDDDMKLVGFLGVLSVQRESMARCLVRIFFAKRALLKYVTAVTRAEIMATPNPEIIFRDNTLASKTVDVLQKYVGAKFLHEVVQPFVQPILATVDSAVELDASRIGDGGSDAKAAAARNVQKLMGLCTELLQSIVRSIGKLPAVLRHLYAHLQEAVAERFGDELGGGEQLRHVQLIVVSSFFFLRFIGPAVLSPKLFKLSEQHPERNPSRTLTLVAKTLQNLANFIKFGDKEPYMHPMNAFIGEQMPVMKALLDELASPSAGKDKAASAAAVGDYDPSVRVDFFKELSKLHVYLAECRAHYTHEAYSDKIDAPTLARVDEILNDLSIDVISSDSDDDSD
jgi:GTPase-activator protein for Ras-like GTPase/C2 domain